MSWSSRKKREGIFVPFIFFVGYCFNICFLSQILLHIKKHYFIHFRCLFLQSSKAFSVCHFNPLSGTVCNFRSMNSPVELNRLFLKLFCYITWFDQTRHCTPCKRGLYVKSCCFLETIAQWFKGHLRYKTITSQMCHRRHRLRIFLFCRKVVFRFQDIHVFILLTIP